MKRIRLDGSAGLGVCAALLLSDFSRAATVTVVSTVTSNGYVFTNFTGPSAGTNAGAGTNINGISNTGVVVGFDIDNNGSLFNYTNGPPTSLTSNPLNINGALNAMALGINSAGTVVGTDGSTRAFFLSGGPFARHS